MPSLRHTLPRVPSAADRASNAETIPITPSEIREEANLASFEKQSISADSAQQVRRQVECLLEGNPVGMSLVVAGSKHPARLHLAGAVNALAKLAAMSDDPASFLDAITDVIAHD